MINLLKKCIGCHLNKPIIEFIRKNKEFKLCNDCSAYHKDYYAKNHNKIIKQKTEYRKNNENHEKEKRKKYYENNKEKIKQISKTFRKNNPEKILAQNKKNKVKAFVKKYNLPENYIEQLEQLLQIDRCPICQTKFEYGRKNIWNSASFDHIIPNNNNISNFHIICTKCNRIKYNLTLEELFLLSEDPLLPTVSDIEINEKRLNQIYNNKKQSAKLKNISFSITKNDLRSILVSYCPILKIPINYQASKANPNGFSIDRINPNLGYILGNCRVISFKANAAKWKASKDDIKKIFKYMKTLMDYNFKN